MTAYRARQLDLEDIQGNVLRGYKMPCAAYCFYRVEDGGAGRGFLRALLEHVTREGGEEWRSGKKPDSTLNIAFTFEGLRAMEVDRGVLETFPADFREGMAARRAQRSLRDTGLSAPRAGESAKGRWKWEKHFRPSQAHMLVTIHARHGDARKDALDRLEERAKPHAVSPLHQDLAAALGDEGAEREHFGFTDGFSQPAIEGVPGRDMKGGKQPGALPGGGVALAGGGWRPVKPGEFILGYEDEDGLIPPSPAAPFANNGTFMVYRKLYQDVARFRRFSESEAADPGGLGDEEKVAAKIVGRWRDGSPLGRSPHGPDPKIGNDSRLANDFTYSDDVYGYRCPLGAHVRRANPRDALEGGSERTRRHQLIRRGMPYGPPLEGERNDRVDRGLIFICFNASIARQFEVVQRWLMDGNVFGLGDESDFLLGRNEEDTTGKWKMTVQGEPPVTLSPQEPFVITKGGEYLFLPGMRSLQALAAE